MPRPVSAYCGLYCGACSLFLETLRQPASATLDPGQDRCLGCRSEVIGGRCAHCSLKACARTHGVEFCDQCGQFPCTDWSAFRDDPRHPHQVEVGDHLGTRAVAGEDEWLRRMKRKWTCAACGARADWYTRACTRCGARTPGFRRPDRP